MSSGSRSVRRARPAAPLAILPAALALAAVVALAVAASGMLSDPGTEAVAYPAELGPAAARELLSAHAAGEILDIDTALVALSDFSTVRLVPLSEAARRVRPGDPRDTPFLQALLQSFSFTDSSGQSWRVAYLDRAGGARAAASALAEAGIPVMADARGRAGGLTVWFAWLLPLVHTATFALRKPRCDLAYRLAISAGWLPLAAAGGLEALLLALVLQAAAHSLYALAPPRRSAGGAFAHGRPPSRRALCSLSPYGISALALSALSPRAVPFLLGAMALSALAFFKGAPLAAMGRRATLHEPPAFTPITRRAETARAASPRIPFAAAALAAVLVSLSVPAGPSALPRQAAGLVRQALPLGDDPAGDHVAYQLALTYGRLGEAAWGVREYTVAGTMEKVRAGQHPEFGKLRGKLAQVMDGSAIMAIRPADGSTAMVPAGRLGLEGAFFCIMALAPVWGLIFAGWLPSRQKPAAGGRLGLHI